MLSSGRLRGTFLHSHLTHLEVAWVVPSPAEIGLGPNSRVGDRGDAARSGGCAGQRRRRTGRRARVPRVARRADGQVALRVHAVPRGDWRDPIRSPRQTARRARGAGLAVPVDRLQAGSHLTLISLARAPRPGRATAIRRSRRRTTCTPRSRLARRSTVSHWKKLVNRAHVNPPTQPSSTCRTTTRTPTTTTTAARRRAQRRRANPHHHPHPETAESTGLASATIGVGDPAVLTAAASILCTAPRATTPRGR